MQIEASRFDNLKIFFPCISILFRRTVSQIVLYKLFNNIFRANKRTITIFVYLKNVYEICQFRDSFFSWGYESFSPFPSHIRFHTKLNCSQYHIQPSILSFLSEFNDPVNRKTIKQIDAAIMWIRTETLPYNNVKYVMARTNSNLSMQRFICFVVNLMTYLFSIVSEPNIILFWFAAILMSFISMRLLYQWR